MPKSIYEDFKFWFQSAILKTRQNNLNEIRKQKVTQERVFVESAFKMQCYIHKNTLLRVAFFPVIFLLVFRWVCRTISADPNHQPPKYLHYHHYTCNEKKTKINKLRVYIMQSIMGTKIPWIWFIAKIRILMLKNIEMSMSVNVWYIKPLQVP